MKMKKIFVLTFVLPCLLFQIEALAQALTSKVEWASLNMGFAIPASANTMVKSAAGQAFVGAMQQGNTRIESGFLTHPLLRELPVGVSEKENGEEIPTQYELEQNYPNPFNPSTTIAFALPKSSEVTLKIFDIFGREIVTLVDAKLPAGRHQVIFNASTFSSGTYFYRLQANEFSQTRRLTLVK